MFVRLFAMLGAYAQYILALFVGVVVAYLVIHSMFLSPAISGDAPQMSFIVEKGWTLKDVATKLEDQKLVKSANSFYWLSRIRSRIANNPDFVLYPGEYALSANMTPGNILDEFIEKRLVLHKVIFPEGITTAEVPAVLARSGLVTIPDVQDVLDNRVLMVQLEVPTSFEGYLFPATYEFSRMQTAEEMVSEMVKKLKSVFTKEMYDQSMALQMNLSQVLTLASIIEKETGNPEERPTISSVFHNRLRQNWPLQSDPTVIYGIPNFDGNITKEHLNQDTPYNTYLHTGLPPTPICNPGLESIKAALFPADTDFLYFVAKGDGSHQFSATYKDHKAAVDLYQKKGAAPVATEKSKENRS